MMGVSPSKPAAQASTTAGQTSSFAQMLADLQLLQKADPKQYSKVTQQISVGFSTAAGKAQSEGNSSLASQLSALSNDFSQASATVATSNTAATSGSHFNPMHFMGGLISKVAAL